MAKLLPSPGVDVFSLARHACILFEASIADLPLVRQHFLERLAQSKPDLPSGLAAPFWLAEVFAEGSLSPSFMAKWIHVYEFALLIDDAADCPGRHNDLNALAECLLPRVFDAWLDEFAVQPVLERSFWNYLAQTKAAIAIEQKVSCNSSAPVYEFRSLGQRAALVKFCGDALALRSRGLVMSSVEADGCDYLSAAIQILDDFTDFGEDWSRGHRATWLGRVAAWLGRDPVDDIEARIALIASGECALALMAVSRYIDVGLLKLGASSDSRLARYFSDLSRRSASVIMQSQTLLNSLGSNSLRREDIDSLRRHLEGTRRANEVISILRSIPRATN